MEDSSLPHIDRHHRQADVEQIYHRHIDTVYRICFSLMGNKPDAEDAAQAVFLKLIKSKPLFTGVEHEKAWLITTAKNHCIDQHRRWWKKNTVALDQLSPAVAALPDKADATLELLKRLPPKLRIVLYLYYYEGYKIAEIASLLSLNANTVKSQLRAAKKRLKMNLGDEQND